MPESPPVARSTRLEGWLPWLLAAAAVVVFAQTAQFDFLHWDDHSLVVGNPFVRSASWGRMLERWTEDYLGFYIPATYSMWAFEAFFLGFGGGRFHVVNLLLHAVNVVLVFEVVRQILTARRARAASLLAACGALIFAVHPLRVEAVAWVTAMKDLLSTSFALLALRSHFGVRGTGATAARYWPPGTLWFVLALLAKPSVVVLGPVVAVLEIAILGKPWRVALGGTWLWFVIAVPFGVITRNVQPAAMLESIPPLWLRPFIATDTLQFYFLKLLVPLRLAPVYARTPDWLLATGAWQWTWIAPGILALGTGWAAWRRRFAPLGLLVAIILALGPVLGLVPWLGYRLSNVADHYMYFPFLIVSLAVSLLLAELPLARQGMGVAAVLVLSAVYTALTVAYVPVWRNGATFFPYAIAHAPQTRLLRMNYGEYLFASGQYEESLVQFHEAARIGPHADIFNNIGSALVALNRYNEAKLAFEQALEFNPTDQEIIDNLNRLKQHLGP